jgi:hypothetical protein
MGFRRRAGLAGIAMELFTQLFDDLLAFVYHCFDRIVIYGYLSGFDPGLVIGGALAQDLLTDRRNANDLTEEAHHLLGPRQPLRPQSPAAD